MFQPRPKPPIIPTPPIIRDSRVVLCWHNLEKALFKLENEIKECERWSYVKWKLLKILTK